MTQRVASHTRPVIGVLPGWQVFWVSLQPFLEPMLRGIHAAARSMDCNLLIACGLYRQNDMRHQAAWSLTTPGPDYLPVSPSNTDGLIIITNPPNRNLPQLQSYFNSLTQTQHPIVSIGFSNARTCILPDNFRGVYQGLQHLYAHGHRHLAYIAGYAESAEATDSHERLAAYQQFLRDYGLPYDARLVGYGEHDIMGGYKAMLSILNSGVPFTAVFASDDGSAMGAVNALHEQGLRVPQDVAIIGFDNDLFAGSIDPPLTSIQLPSFDMGYQAVEQLLAELRQPSVQTRTTRIIGPLIIRESCGCSHTAPLEGAVLPAPAEDAPLAALSHQLYAAVLTETHHIRSGDLLGKCQHLAAAYALSCTHEDPSSFSTALEHILESADAVGDDLSVWQNALTHLEYHTQQSRIQTAFSTQLLMQARLRVAQRAGYQYSRSVIRHNDMTDYLSRLNAQLHTALTLEDILQGISVHLDVLHIRTMHIALFEPGGEGGMGSYRLYSLRPDGYRCHPEALQTEQFPALAPAIATSDYHLALVPLIIESRQVGFVIFDADNLPLCGSLTWQISAALRGSQLYQRAAQDRQAAEDANRLKSRFLAMVSHELRTPLALITGLSEMLLRGDYDMPAAEQSLQRIYATAHHLHSLVGDVMDLASTQVGQMRLTWDTVDMRQVLDAAARAGEQLTQDKGLAWHYDVPEVLPPVHGDATRLRQVALNLVANAVKFTDYGMVRLSASVEAGSIRVSIQDTGLGIPESEQGLIFDEFQKSDRTSARAYGGLGLGLAICKRLIESHRGSINVISSGAEGDGSTFYFTLPIMSPDTLAEGDAQELHFDWLSKPLRAADLEVVLSRQGWQKQDGASRTILIVDDDPGMREMHTRILREASPHYQLITARHGGEAIQKLEDTRPDLILLDLMMPEMDGFRLLDYLRGQHSTRHIPVIIITAHPLDAEDMVRLNRGVSTIISKGIFTPDETLTQVEQVLARSRKLGTETQQIVRRAMAYIHTHYATSLAREDIARHVSVSEDYLTRCFKQETGISPIAYLNRYRVNHAKRLLEDTSHNMTDIAHRVGFSDNMHFSRVFRRETGITPSEYRARHR